MKSARTAVTSKDGIVTISRGKRTNASYLSFCCSVDGVSQNVFTPIDSGLNYIRIPRRLQNKVTGKFYTLVNATNGSYVDVIIDGNPSKEESRIEMTSFVKRMLAATEHSALILCHQHSCELSSVKLQRLENIKDDKIGLSENTAIKDLLKDFTLFEILNPLTGASIFVRSKHIDIDPSLKSHEIRINKKQRNMLNDNIPTRLTKEQWDRLSQAEGAPELLNREYKADGPAYTISDSIDEMPYNDKLSLHRLTKEVFGERLIVKPVLESFRHETKKRFYRWLSDVYVGKSTLSLNCRRPHECDENADIVRMTENNMQFLGIEPMDRVVIQFKETAVSCHVLPFDEEKFRHTNIASVIEYSIGIPAHIRNELKITDIQSSVKVDRDTAFIFKKSFNEQLVPIILTLLSLNFFEQISWYLSLILIAVLIPVVMYITLSSKRNMRGK